MRLIVPVIFIFSALTFFTPALAYEPRIVGTPGQHDVTMLERPEIERMLYGELRSHPHMYEFGSREPFHLAVEIWMPESDETLNNISGIILRVLPNGSVEEVARLKAKDASWEPFYEPWGGDSYRRGPRYEGDLTPGVYRVEMSTPDNIGKYIFVLGTEKDPDGLGYFAKIAEIARVKDFLGKPTIAIVISPYIYVPALLIIILSVAAYTLRRTMRRI